MAVIEAPCGSGKSAYPTALSCNSKVITLTGTKVLQSQYADIYNFAKVVGRGNFPCINPERLFDDATAEDCVFGIAMSRCPLVGECPYVRQKEAAKDSPRAVLNYHFWNLTGNRRYDDGSYVWAKDTLVLDEAHALSETCLNYFSVRVQPKHRDYYNLPEFPYISSGMPVSVQTNRAEPWLQLSASILAERIKFISRRLKLEQTKYGKERLSSDLRRTQRMQMQLRAVLVALRAVPEDWFISSNGEGLLVKPLTGRHVFPRMFLSDVRSTVIAMSATIGDFKNFCSELGIQEYQSHRVPNRFAPEERPIYVLKNCPRMSSRATEDDFERQADLIYKQIVNCPSDWSGLLLVTRRSEAAILRDRLARRGLGNRVWAMPGHDGTYVPTDQQVVEWQERKRRIPNSIGISFSFWFGYDGQDERILGICKAPYPVWGSEGSYESAWRRYSMERYNYTCAVHLTQGAGRIRRGEPSHYDTPTEQRKLVFIADGSFDGRIKKMMSPDILDSLVEV